MFRRGTVYYTHDNKTGKQESLHVEDHIEAERLLHAKNEAQRQPTINLHIARAYLMVGDAMAAKRTWQDVMDELLKLKKRKADGHRSALGRCRERQGS